jgi:hypothetical protein
VSAFLSKSGDGYESRVMVLAPEEQMHKQPLVSTGSCAEVSQIPLYHCCRARGSWLVPLLDLSRSQIISEMPSAAATNRLPTEPSRQRRSSAPRPSNLCHHPEPQPVKRGSNTFVCDDEHTRSFSRLCSKNVANLAR